MFDNLLELLLDTVPYSIWMMSIDRKFSFANKFFCDSLNKSKEEVLGKTLFDLYEKELAIEYTGNYDEVLKLNKAKLFTGYQGDLFLECYIAPIKDEDEIVGFLAIHQDQTERKKNEEEIIRQKNLLKTIMDTIPDSIFYKNIEGTYLDCNIAFAKDYYNLEKEDVINKKDIEIVKDSKLIKKIVETDSKVIDSKTKEVNRIKIKDNENIKYMESIKTPILDDNGKIWGIVGVSRDITSRILLERDLKKLSYIDKLTGVYNRAYFDKKVEDMNKESYLPLSLIVGDVDGLKIVNDTLGHLKGDELLIQITDVLKKVCKKNNLIVRWGGDEFVILLPNTEYEDSKILCKKIKDACKEEGYKHIPLSISLGCSTKRNLNQSIDDILKEAEDEVYKQKLPSQSNSKNHLLVSLQDTLKEKCIDTQEHTDRVVKYAKRLANKMNLSEDRANELVLAATLHDIGKIGIPDDILLKPGKLTDSEYKTIKTHTEKGYRIAKSNYEIAHIAKCILSHHERWDGRGYPLGLKGEEIPYLARLVCVIDSYDAMTSSRPYKDKISNKKACEEIKRCSGSQFDPNIVKIFLEEFEG
ncbi:sensor domain-containing diguanylate cyclase/phosphohydrolase [[Clostridium] dakarense]|uniref:sensor domain-containing diguanylate cyclase/phosphohydrolase n=1 Tax=Faecalimicrobium dakarense TaxID=1301100 RepID=UPI0004BC3FEC|nr:HD domain-containing phosphohydrolase [[Clostridium] dakarense]